MQATPTAPTPVVGEKLPKGVAPTLAVLAVSVFVMLLNETALSVALPTFMRVFSVDAPTVQWLSTAFMLVMAVVIPTTGYLLQRFSRRGLFAAAMVLFLVGSVVAALAPGFSILLVARMLQAAGTALVMPLLMTVTMSEVPPARRGAVMGLNSVVIASAPAIGPTIAGLVLAAFDWRWIFWGMVVIGLITVAIGMRLVHGGQERGTAPLDTLSVLLSALAFGGVVYALAGIETALTGAWLVPAVSLVVGLAALAGFVLRQLRLAPSGRALLDLAPFTNRVFSASALTITITFGVMLGTVVVITLVLQRGMGLSTAQAGLAVLPLGAVQVVLSPLLGRAYDAVGARPIAVPSAVAVTLSMAGLSLIGPAFPLWAVIVLTTLLGAGMSGILSSLMTASLAALPRHQFSHGAAIVNTLQQLAGGAGTAVLTVMITLGTTAAMQRGDAEPASTLEGARWAFLVAGVFCLVAILMAARIRPTSEGSERTRVTA